MEQQHFQPGPLPDTSLEMAPPPVNGTLPELTLVSHPLVLMPPHITQSAASRPSGQLRVGEAIHGKNARGRPTNFDEAQRHAILERVARWKQANFKKKKMPISVYKEFFENNDMFVDKRNTWGIDKLVERARDLVYHSSDDLMQAQGHLSSLPDSGEMHFTVGHGTSIEGALTIHHAHPVGANDLVSVAPAPPAVLISAPDASMEPSSSLKHQQQKMKVNWKRKAQTMEESFEQLKKEKADCEMELDELRRQKHAWELDKEETNRTLQTELHLRQDHKDYFNRVRKELDSSQLRIAGLLNEIPGDESGQDSFLGRMKKELSSIQLRLASLVGERAEDE